MCRYRAVDVGKEIYILISLETIGPKSRANRVIGCF